MLSPNFLNPQYQLDFNDLYDQQQIHKVYQAYLQFLQQYYPELLIFYQDSKQNIDSTCLINIAIAVEDFLIDLFLLDKQNAELRQQDLDLKAIYQARLNYIQRYIAKQFKNFANPNFCWQRALVNLDINNKNITDIEFALARKINSNNVSEDLEQYCLWAFFSKDGKKMHQNGTLFRLPQKITHQLDWSQFNTAPRKDFALCDNADSNCKIIAEANYCLHCHGQKKDSCRTGLVDKNTQQIKKNSLQVALNGCPLDQKISEMNYLKSKGHNIAALAMATLDNPLLAATGHRICNDCSSACIFQQQQPVDIPQIETAILRSVLSLPYGFEIYSLLTRFQPLNIDSVLPKPYNGKKVLVCGLGPAGYTLAHYLLNCGYEIVAIDGLKIEPLPINIGGTDVYGNKSRFEPIKFWQEQSLLQRTINGFGGVSEYGITARWNKNFLDLIYILLLRRQHFRLYSGLRFGSSLTAKLAFQRYGFAHIAMCLGAGNPKFLRLANNFAKGVRLASDFLMSLQLAGNYQQRTFNNLQLEQPIIVVGGGLTAIDTACEAKVYYQVQLTRLKTAHNLNEEEQQILARMLADAELQQQNKLEVATTIIYRQAIINSPAYKLNAYEVEQAIKQGIAIREHTTIKQIIVDKYQHISAVKLNDDTILPCRSLFFAIGTSPNIAVATIDQEQIANDGTNLLYAKMPENSITNYNFINKINRKNYLAISSFGDLHPQFQGSVVKAMASAKHGYRQIDWLLQQPKHQAKIKKSCYQQDFINKIVKISSLAKSVVQIDIFAPLLAKQTKPGHIFRLQNYQAFAQHQNNQKLMMEGVAVTALAINNNIITGIVLETGGSTSLVKNFRVGEPCIFMGPSGKPTFIPKNQRVLLIGGGRGNQPLTALAKMFKKNGCYVLFFAGYHQQENIANLDKMHKNCHELIIATSKPATGYFCGNVVDAVQDYFDNNSCQIDYIFTIGNNDMMHSVAKLRQQHPLLAQAKHSITSLNSPMQCMLKGVCGQCLQKRISAEGQEEYFYACADQDQDSDKLDFEHLHNRCRQNSLLEKINKLQ
jgi:NADPH-dependent glutamate synthase beta subunit-like oxidoreductase/NAD(P)H-flavin reductase